MVPVFASTTICNWIARPGLPGFAAMVWMIVVLAGFSLPANAVDNEESFSRMDLLDNERLIRPDDRILYQVIEEQAQAVTLLVDSQGRVRIPLIGDFVVAGKTCYTVAREIKPLLEVDFFHRATVVLELQAAAMRQMATVYGQVRNQGRITLPGDRPVTLSAAISLAGGFSEGANRSNVSVIRRDAADPEKEDRMVVDLKEVQEKGMVEKDIIIQSDDVIIVAREDVIGGQYSVHGAVNSPGLYTISTRDLTVSRAILLAGGFSNVARETRVKLTRMKDDGSGESETFYINVRKVYDGAREEDMDIRPDDIIRVDERILVF
ncbi:MAG TPA: SLBB domain-containing protein [Opitutales bacterium]|nr:SLBB domain-containing protein [Opitutales bacterium]